MLIENIFTMRWIQSSFHFCEIYIDVKFTWGTTLYKVIRNYTWIRVKITLSFHVHLNINTTYCLYSFEFETICFSWFGFRCQKDIWKLILLYGKPTSYYVKWLTINLNKRLNDYFKPVLYSEIKAHGTFFMICSSLSKSE